MYQTALKHYQNQKWSKAAMLFEAAAPYYSGTMQEDSIAFMTAFCKFKTRDYEVATSMLDDFRRKFGRSVFLEDAEGILALSYFYLAPGPTRDQTMTTQAIVAVMYLIVKSGSKLADNSVQDKQADRYLSTLDSYYSFVAEFPESHYLKELDRLAQNAKDFLDRNNKEKQ